MKLINQIPCFNEAQTLEIALNALPKVCRLAPLNAAMRAVLMTAETGWNRELCLAPFYWGRAFFIFKE
jgi:hypothetical protein